ncbi:MAG TPA: M28 family peptidase [Thermomicrobiales bacterium]|nr:M28 family peptidase [Thermomicrobiales bacterium]
MAALIIVGLLLLVGSLVVLFVSDERDDGMDSGTPDVTADLVGATLVASPPDTVPIASASPLAPGATPVASPGATPLASPGATPIPPLLSGQCREGCLIRVPRNDLTVALLKETGERPSYESDTWVWTIVSAKTVMDLQASDVPVFLVRDSPETLYLYATRLPKDQSGSRVVREFGEVLDSVDGHSIVRVDDVPANVTDLIAARVWVEKVKPAAPGLASQSPAGIGEPISEVDLGVLLPEVDAEEIEQTIAELQEMSSTDGTGIGTRHYTSTGNAMAAEYLFTRLESYGLTVWYEDFVTPEGLLSTNVIGEIPGQDPGSIYAVMAHLDSVAADTSSAPGADDNATGLAASLEIARILSGYELKYPVHIILVNAEETAILGSDAYARDAVQEETPLEGVFNLDSIGSDRNGPRVYLNADEGSAWMMDLLVRINDGYGLGQELWVRQNPEIIADDNMLRAQGIEAVLVARELFGMSPVHHTADDIKENVSIPYTIEATQLVLLAIAALVQ